MNISESILNYKKVILFFAFLATATGILSWFTMPAQEDPAMKERFGLIQIVYPGGPPDEIERLVARPLEKKLARVSEIKEVTTTIRADFSVTLVELQDSVSSEEKINEAWRNVENAIQKTRPLFPEGVLEPLLNRNVSDLDAVVLAVHGSEDPLVLYEVAKELEETLLRQSGVVDTGIPGNPGEEIRIQIDDQTLEQTGIGVSMLAGLISGSNRALPGGSVRMGDRRVNILTNSSFRSMEEIRSFPILLASGRVLSLDQMATVEKNPTDPPIRYFYLNGKRAVGVTVVPGKNQDLIQFGKNVRKRIEDFKRTRPQLRDRGIEISEVSFQPDYVEDRIRGLSLNLATSMLTVALVVFIGMGWRMGLLVSSLVPVIVITSLGIFAMTGGALHQISIAAFIMSLGILIDNVIVVVESIHDGMEGGLSPFDAAKTTISSLALPLATATGTTVAAFLPMLGSSGATADFTRSIPTIAILTLITSFFFAVFVTPSLSMIFLKVHHQREKGQSRLDRIATQIGDIAFRRKWLVLLLTFVYLILATGGFFFVRKKFFPSADRDQLTVSIQNPEGTHLEATREDAFTLYESIKDIPEIENISMFVGQGVPRFYYNVTESPRSPHLAQFIVDLSSFEDSHRIREQIRAIAKKVLPTTMVMVHEMEQGPPINAPIEIMLIGEDPEKLSSASEKIQSILETIPGTRSVRNDMGIGSPGIRFVAGDTNAMQYGMNRSSVTGVVLARTKGIPAGYFRASDEAIPIYLRSGEGQSTGIADLKNSIIRQTESRPVLLGDLATLETEWQPSLIRRKNQERFVTVLSDLSPGGDATKVMAELEDRLSLDMIPEGVRLETRGETGESGEANQAILAALPPGVGLFLISLLIEFRSFRKMGILLFALPLAMTGVVPGLILTANPFGFLSLLGMLALVGIAVNNGILILDAAERAKSDGKSIPEAVQMAIQGRIRPILLTTATTVSGLLPLAFTSASLWPPFAWSIISGLTISALLSLFVIPALYSIIYGWGEKKSLASISHYLLLLLLILPGPLMANPDPAKQTNPDPAKQTNSDQRNFATWKESNSPVILSFREALRLGATSPEARKARLQAKEALSRVETYQNSIYYPKAGAGANYFWNSHSLGVDTPIGTLGARSPTYAQGAIEIEQNLFDPQSMFYTIPAAKKSAEAARHLANRKEQEAIANVAAKYLDVLSLAAKKKSTEELIRNLQNRLVEIRRFYRFGRVSRVDLLQLQLSLSDAKSGLRTIEKKEGLLLQALSRALGISGPIQILSLSDQDFPSKSRMERILNGKEVIDFSRDELLALESELEAKKLEKEALEWWILPSLFLKGSLVHDTSGQYNRSQWATIQAGIKIPLYEAKTRSSRIKTLEYRIENLQLQKKEAIPGIRLEIENAKIDYEHAVYEIKRLEKNLRSAKQAATMARARYRNGRAILQELMDAETILFQTDEKLRLSKIRKAEAWVKLFLAAGKLSNISIKEVENPDDFGERID